MIVNRIIFTNIKIIYCTIDSLNAIVDTSLVCIISDTCSFICIISFLIQSLSPTLGHQQSDHQLNNHQLSSLKSLILLCRMAWCHERLEDRMNSIVNFDVLFTIKREDDHGAQK